MQAEAPSIAVVGASGAVGREALGILAERGHPVERLSAFASPRSAGATVPYGEAAACRLEPFNLQAVARSEFVLLAVGRELAGSIGEPLAELGCRVVDNSSAFRADAGVPLVVPEVNATSLGSSVGLVANPNCSTILLIVALEPLRLAFGVERLVVSTYQAVSGAGQAAIDELLSQTRSVLEGQPHAPDAFGEPCAFNIFPHESAIDPSTGANQEELKLIREVRRIWQSPRLRIVPTCARVPVVRSHCQSITVTLSEPAREADVREALSRAPGVELLDDWAQRRFPTSLRAAGRDSVLVGRIRPAPDEVPDAEGRVGTFCLWLAGDQLRKGAALNAIQTLDLMGLDAGRQAPPRAGPFELLSDLRST